MSPEASRACCIAEGFASMNEKSCASALNDKRPVELTRIFFD
jgi:hypothetical protein